MKDKQVYNRLRAEAELPVQADSRKLLSNLNLPLPEGQPKKAKKRRWHPATALTCTAAIAVAICVPVYLNMQDNHGIAGGVTSSAPEEKKELVWSMGEAQIQLVLSKPARLMKNSKRLWMIPQTKASCFVSECRFLIFLMRTLSITGGRLRK